MRCAYFDDGACRSCELMGIDYATQLAGKEAAARTLLSRHPDAVWSPPAASAETGFRATAKMVVGGTIEAPTLGILDAGRHGVDLRGCGIQEPVIREILPAVADFIGLARLEPYDVPGRRGELKYALLVTAPGGATMLRLVTRSTESLARIRKHLPALLAAAPRLRVMSVNVQPAHAAVIEGEREIVLTDETELRMPTGAVELRVRPGSFVQTNSAIASALYAQARAWTDELAAASVWDLYCGVGGFGLSVAAPGRSVVGVEVSGEAIESARSAAEAGGIPGTRFEAADATEWAIASDPDARPGLVIVNPPRRGLGDSLSDWLEGSGVPSVVYSSCNPASLARDLDRMPSYRVRRARLFDMFPQTRHSEVMVLLERTDRGAA